MDEKEKRALLVATGKELLQEELVARTWGDRSCRLDSSHRLITPSGSRPHAQTREDDIVVLVNSRDGGMGRKARGSSLLESAACTSQRTTVSRKRSLPATHASETCDRE